MADSFFNCLSWDELIDVYSQDPVLANGVAQNRWQATALSDDNTE